MTSNLPDREITELLVAWSSGDSEALEQLTPLVYDRLRRLAGTFLRRERQDHTLQTTALIHEAFLRLIEQDRVTYHNRSQFFANTGQMMRRILVDYARGRKMQKRGGGAERLAEEELDQIPTPEPDLDLVAVQDALQDLEKENADLARIVDLKYFVGLKLEEIAAVEGISTATAHRRWRLARAWLYRQLGGDL